MPISVVCQGCKARFEVSDKFAGKQGPCPKCKAVITIPAAVAEVKVHAPTEFAEGGEDQKGRPITKPIARPKSKLGRRELALILGGMLLSLAAAWLAGKLLPAETHQVLLCSAGLAIVSLPLVVAAYAVLRDEELEPYRGKALWLRSIICATVYAVLWAGYYFVPSGFIQEYWSFLYIAPPFLVLGIATALATLDLDFTNAGLHYSFYLLSTLILRWAAGIDPVWMIVKPA